MATVRRVGSGSHVLLADLDESILAETRARLHGQGYEVTTHGVDVASPESVGALARAAAGLGPVTRFVHTAGLSLNQGSVQRVLAVDLVGVALVLEAFRDVIAPGGSGVVVASMIGSLYTGQLTDEEARELATVPAESPPSWPTCSAPTPVTSRAPTSSSTEVWSPRSRPARRRNPPGSAAPANNPRRR